MTEPVRETEAITKSKYRPDDCSDCGLPWGVVHGNALGTGFTQIGAEVWKYNRCDGITHSPGFE